jgi:two-component system, sensor histidine kinase
VSLEDRLTALLARLEKIAAGDLSLEIPVSPARDEVDAVGYTINVLVGELRFANEKLQRAKEEAERASHAKSGMLRNMSHEIRTPAAAILLLSDQLGDGNERVRAIRSNSEALLQLVDDMLDLSKVEAGKLAVSPGTMQPAKLLTDVCNSLRPLAHAKRLALEVELDPRVPASFSTDGTRLRQILMNVVGNAVKFTEQGWVRVAAKWEAGSPMPLVILVRDTGIGISDAERRELFEPFARGRRVERFSGSGLGLSLSRRLARLLGGELDILESTEGRGSTFRVRLSPMAAARASRLSGLRVLLTEDNDDVRFAVASLLGLFGCEVALAEDGVRAIDLATRERFDVILMDVHMPRLDGLEATRQLRRRGLRTPIIALTADALEVRRRECLAVGCNDHLVKPFDVGLLEKKLLAFLPR